MSQVEKKWIADGAVDASKINLGNDTFLKGRNQADSADVNIIKVSTSDTLVLASKLSDPDSTAPTADAQLANKKYVDDQVATITIPTVFELQGNWSAATNSPTLANTDTGVANYLYYVNAAGSVDFGAGSIAFAVGDWVYNVNGAWEKADNNDDVLSVNGQTGTVVLDTDDISEGVSNFYYTEGRFDTSFAAKDTDDLSEGVSNLYFTEARVRSTPLTGLSLADATDVTAADTVLQAAGKLQAQLDALVSTTPEVEKFTLTGTDISNGYVDLANTPIQIMSVFPVGGLPQEEGIDYTVSTNRVTFAGDLASLLASGDVLQIGYIY